MRRALVITALLASHGVALWLGRHSPVENAAAVAPSSASAPATRVATDLASFLRHAKSPEELVTEEEAEDEDSEDSLAKARLAIPSDLDVAAVVKAAAGDPDLPVSRETRIAFGVWADRDPLAALRWLVDWARDSGSPEDLLEEFSRHLREGGAGSLGVYLEAVPAARSFLFEQVAYLAKDWEPDFAFALAASLKSHEDRLGLLASRFGNDPDLKNHLVMIRQLLDDRMAAEFLAKIGRVSAAAGLFGDVARAGFPPTAVANFAAQSEIRGQTRTDADFMGTIPGLPAATGYNVIDIATSTQRSPDGAINRNNIDAMLNNPNRAAMGAIIGNTNNIEAALGNPNQAADIPVADRIRGYFTNRNAVSWAWFASGELEQIPGYPESREQFLRGQISGEEWIAALEQAVPGGSGLHDEISALAFRAAVDEDPSRAMGLLSPSFPHQDLLADLSVSPEVALLMAERLSGGEEPSLAAMELLGKRFSAWFEEDPQTCAAYVAELPAGPVKESLQPWMVAPPDKGEEEGP